MVRVKGIMLAAAGRAAPPGRSSTPMRMLAAGALLWLAAGRAQAIVLDDPDHFAVKHTWSAVELGVTTPLGGLVFSADGATLYIVGGADKPTSGLYALPVTRDAGNQVTGFGSAMLVFTGSGGLDAGLERGPAGTLFYSYFETNQLAERPPGSGGDSTFDLAPLGVPAAISGLTFSPVRIDPGTGFGRLQISTGFGNALHEIPLVPAGGGLFTPGAASIFVTLPRASIAGLQYVPGGTLAGNLLYANFDQGQLRVLRIDAASGLPIDAQSGEPTLGTTSPAENSFASDFGVGPLGLEFDARTGDDLFVTTFGGSPSDSLIQIGGFAGTFATTTTITTSSTTLTTEPPPTSTSVPLCSDADNDGVPDALDRCPATPSGLGVDDSGCSQAQFCALFDARTRDGARVCKKADWKNDEPTMKAKEADCAVLKGTRGPEDDRCVPATP